MEKVTRGIRNNNPFNIRISSNNWKGKINNFKNTDKSFEQFIDVDYGLRAGILLLRGYLSRGYNTPRLIINLFAPPSENETSSYLDFVCGFVGVDYETKFSFNTLEFYSLCAAICKIESNYNFSPDKYRDICCRFNLCKPYNFFN